MIREKQPNNLDETIRAERLELKSLIASSVEKRMRGKIEDARWIARD